MAENNRADLTALATETMQKEHEARLAGYKKLHELREARLRVERARDTEAWATATLFNAETGRFLADELSEMVRAMEVGDALELLARIVMKNGLG